MKVWQSKNIKVWQFNIELPYDPAILFLGIYQKKKKHTKTCSHMLKAPFFIIAKKCKQPKCSPTDERIDRMWNIIW